MNEGCKHVDQERPFEPKILALALLALFCNYKLDLSREDKKRGGGGARITPTEAGEDRLLDLMTQSPDWGAELRKTGEKTLQRWDIYVAGSGQGLENTKDILRNHGYNQA